MQPQEPKIIKKHIQLCGGWSKTEPVNQEMKDYLQKNSKRVNEEYLKLKNEEVKKIEAISYSRQVVNGYNTNITAKVNDKDIIVFNIYEHHSGEIRDVSCYEKK